MRFEPLSRRAGSMLAVTVALLLSACGAQGSEESSVDAEPSSTETIAASGTDLTGIHFDVRRDPG